MGQINITLNTANDSQPKESNPTRKFTKMPENSFLFSVVGMQYRDENPNHIFSEKDEVRLEPDLARSKTAIKVLVDKKHVAYVAAKDSARLSVLLAESNGIYKITFIKHFAQSAQLSFSS
jgi:hypothetical protein